MLKKSQNKTFGVYYFTPKVLKFKNLSIISDDDMIHLFMGFVRLIKKSVEIDVESKYLKKIKILENRIKNLTKVN